MITNIFTKGIVLEDERVLLRPIVKEDYNNLISFAINEPDLWKYSLVNPAGEENMKKYVDAAVENRMQEKEYPFIVFDKQTNEYAGSTRFYDIQPVHKTTLLGYTWYGKKFQRTGLNRHCKFLLLQFCFEQWGLERVELRASINNERSIAAMKAIGCIQEGILRNHLSGADNERRTTVILSMLKDEWFSTAKELLRNKTN
ncbi:MAG TPA: GNAT family protein [Ferruginibacter sp.]|jgi:RimJ/RimL family protein N-acetyltransferase|nr:GNAT family protein [Ferruginibacter sp.]